MYKCITNFVKYDSMESYRQSNPNFEEIINYLGKMCTLQYKYFTVQIYLITN